MLHTILVPLDGSRLAEQALPEARRLARASDATIVLVRVAHVGTALHDRWGAQFNAVAEAEEYLRGKARQLSSAGFGVRTDVYCADPAEGIGLAAMVHGASMIVMSTHGRSGLRRIVLGSVAARVVHDTSLPVLLVRGTHRARHAGLYGKILVPLDGTALAESALRYIARESFAQQATVVLLETVPLAMAPIAGGIITMGYLPQQESDRERREAEHRYSAATQYLYTTALAYLGERRWDSAVVSGTPAEQILELARDEDLDLIVMATHGRIGADRLIHGSVAADVLRHAPVPVLLLRGGAEAARDTALDADKANAVVATVP